MGVVSLIEAIMNTSVDTKGLEEGTQKAEKIAEGSTQKVSKMYEVMGIAIATTIAGTVIVALEKAIHTTAEWGLEMEHLGARMGMTSQEAATLVGIMERFGIQGGIAARSMQVLGMQVRMTQESLDPFSTRMGKVLGTLRDSNGAALSLGQVFDKVRQQISSAASDSEKLEKAQALLGARMGGQLVGALKLNEEEWNKLKKSVEDAQGPVEEAAKNALAYKQATTELEQTFRGLQVAIGSALLPTITDTVKEISSLVSWFKEIYAQSGPLMSILIPFKGLSETMHSLTVGVLGVGEALGLVSKGTRETFQQMDGIRDAAKQIKVEEEAAAEKAEEKAHELEETEKIQKQLVALQKEEVALMEKARSLGLVTQAEERVKVEEELVRLAKQRVELEKQSADPSVTGDQRIRIEADLLKNRVEAASVVARAVNDQYKEEELHIKANGALNLTSEVGLLQKKLSDERIVGDERLQLEAEIYEKRKQYTEEVVKVGRELGFVSAQQEIDYRKQQAAQKLGQGDALGAAQEIVKARDLAIKQADQALEFTKKIQTVSLSSEIEFQKQKLQLVKGNADEEMKIIGQIADLDKQLYDKRLQFALSYTQNAITAYRELQKATGQDTSAVSGPKESQSFESAAREGERARYQNARTLEDVANHGGTEEARNTAVKQAQDIFKEIEAAQAVGKSISDGLKAQADAAKDVLKAANGGEEVRAPGGPNPVAASLLSPEEGLSTSGLNRGSDIPRLDTSFTDLAVRIRDVLLGAVPNIQNFSNAVQAAVTKISGTTGFTPNPGAIGPGGGITNLPTQGSPPFATGISTPATVAPGGTPVTPTPQTGIGVGGFDTRNSELTDKFDELIAAINGAADKTANLQDNATANAENLLAAIQQHLSQPSNVKVQVGIDPNAGEMLVQSIVKDIQ